MDEQQRWDYRNPVHCLFGWGRLRDISSVVSGRALIVTTPGLTRRGVSGAVIDLIGSPTAVLFDRVEPNPTIESAQAAVAQLARSSYDSIIAIGGGSAIDLGKVLSVALKMPTLPLRLLLDDPSRLVGSRPIDLVAVPTTAGTGSEVTPFATLWDESGRKKLSLASELLYPKAAILDPGLTLTLPWEVTLAAGLDALTQCFEAIWNLNATPITTALALRGLDLAPSALRRLMVEPGCGIARSDMLQTSLLSGLAISHTRTALAHSMSYPVTANYGLPHGLACSMMLPAVLAFNLESDDGRLADVARKVGCSSPHELVERMLELLRDLKLRDSVRRYVPIFSALYDLVPDMIAPGRAVNNLRAAGIGDVKQILQTTETWLFDN